MQVSHVVDHHSCLWWKLEGIHSLTINPLRSMLAFCVFVERINFTIKFH